MSIERKVWHDVYSPNNFRMYWIIYLEAFTSFNASHRLYFTYTHVYCTYFIAIILNKILSSSQTYYYNTGTNMSTTYWTQGTCIMYLVAICRFFRHGLLRVFIDYPNAIVRLLLFVNLQMSNRSIRDTRGIVNVIIDE